MLLVTFTIGDERYAMRADAIVEITPVVRMKQLPLSDAYVAGIFSYRGTPVPVIDLCQLFEQRPSRTRMSTRIILVRHRITSTTSHVLGLIAEQVNGTIRRREDELLPSGVTVADAPFLEGICNDADGLIQLVDHNRFLPDTVLTRLFQSDPVTPASTSTSTSRRAIDAHVSTVPVVVDNEHP